jgi:hypothetical protein
LPKIDIDEIRSIVQEAEQEPLGFAVMLEMNRYVWNKYDVWHKISWQPLEESKQESDSDVEVDITEKTA